MQENLSGLTEENTTSTGIVSFNKNSWIYVLFFKLSSAPRKIFLLMDFIAR